ncbi:MAG: NfeD family protein [Clostridia bacterium]|nr:NfeD family protein [Clostridia bacterium]MCL6520776.1 NfeD family protein [Bacillota bacterium]
MEGFLLLLAAALLGWLSLRGEARLRRLTQGGAPRGTPGAEADLPRAGRLLRSPRPGRAGLVRLEPGGEVWSARGTAAGNLAPGERVRVTGRAGFSLLVEPDAPAGRGAGPRAPGAGPPPSAPGAPARC